MTFNKFSVNATMRPQKIPSPKFVLILAFCWLALNAAAQLRKPLVSARDKAAINDAKLNVGIMGGPNLTTWLHLHPDQSAEWYLQPYRPDFLSSVGYFGGICLEYMVNKGFSIGFNALYARHNVKATNTNDHIALGWNPADSSIIYGTKTDVFSAKYHNIEAFVPFTYYFGSPAMKNVKPYVFVAPRLSYVLPSFLNDSSIITYQTERQPSSQTAASPGQVGFGPYSYRTINIGGTMGIGTLLRIETNSYYFLFKLDLSSNLFALSTYSRADLLLYEFNGKRYSGSAQATITFQLPIKKRLQGACMNWGKYN